VDYASSLDYLYGLQRFGIKLGLENIRALLARLGHPDRHLRILHVAGTNGKGSVCAALAEVLHQGGYVTGRYTSPHLHSFTERIQIDGEPIAEGEVAALTAEIRVAAAGIPATFFEFTTALALLYFARKQVEWVVLEVGMGGRLDATNAVNPRLCLITPICLDHAEHLGADLAAIAAEKAGILKPGVPVVIGRQPPAALQVLLERAAALGAPVILLGREFDASSQGATWTYRGQGAQLSGLVAGLPGAHQLDNLAQALAGLERLQSAGLRLSQEALRLGVARVRWPGRLEWWRGEGEVLLDGAHNEGGAGVLAQYLSTLECRGIHWVVGLKGDKRPAALLAPLLPLVSAVYCTVPPVEDAVAPAELAALAAAADVPATSYPEAATALAAALAARQPGEIVLVAGSLFLVAAAREALSGRTA
jgi:dihydrofolate synthase / folylpolyglutamate synthase